MLDEQGETIGSFGIISDITSETKAKEALQKSEERYRQVINNSGQGICVIQDKKVKFYNPKLEEITGYYGEELTPKEFLEYLHPDDRQMVADYHLKRYKGEEVPEFVQYRFFNKSGNIRWIEVNAVVIDWENKPATLGFVTDITERKHTEEALQESEEIYRSLVENASDLIFMVNKKGEVLSLNQAAAKLFGKEPKDIIDRSVLKLFPKKIKIIYDNRKN